MTVDLTTVVQVVSLLGSAAVVSWQFSRLATDMKSVARELANLTDEFKRDREKGEAARLRLAEHAVQINKLEIRMDAVEEKQR